MCRKNDALRRCGAQRSSIQADARRVAHRPAVHGRPAIRFRRPLPRAATFHPDTLGSDCAGAAGVGNVPRVAVALTSVGAVQHVRRRRVIRWLIYHRGMP